MVTLLRHMEIEALYWKLHLSRRHPAYQVYPYLLCDLAISFPNQTLAAEITYIPMRQGFVYLFAVLDWASRRVVTHVTPNQCPKKL